MKTKLIVATILLLTFFSVSPYRLSAESTTKFINDIKGVSALLGEWYYIHNQKGSPVSAPPTFDIIEFLPKQRIRIKSTLDKYDFEGILKYSNGYVYYNFQPPDETKPIEHKMKIAVSDSGKEIILFYKDEVYNKDIGVVYLQKDQLLTQEVVGRWSTNDNGKQVVMSLGKDGSFSIEKEVSGYYRAFSSYRGRTIMAALNFEGNDTHVIFWLYKRQGNTLSLVPVDGETSQDKATIWKLIKSN